MIKQGIAGILASGALDGKSEEEKADMLLRSEVFYYNQYVGPPTSPDECVTDTYPFSLTGSSLTVEDARLSRQSLSTTRSDESQVAASVAPAAIPAPTSGAEEEPQMLSFAQLKALIEQGRTDEIPNNKTIPNVLSVRRITFLPCHATHSWHVLQSAPPSESTVVPPKKPWER